MQTNKLRMLTYSVGLVLIVALLSACGNRFEEQLRGVHKDVQSSLAYLKDQLDGRKLSNALLIGKYANALIQQKPDYADIATLLKEEATSHVDQARSLVEKDIQEQIGEIETINEKKVQKLRREAAGNVSAAARQLGSHLVDQVGDVVSGVLRQHAVEEDDTGDTRSAHAGRLDLVDVVEPLHRLFDLPRDLLFRLGWLRTRIGDRHQNHRHVDRRRPLDGNPPRRQQGHRDHHQRADNDNARTVDGFAADVLGEPPSLDRGLVQALPELPHATVPTGRAGSTVSYGLDGDALAD